MKKTYHNPRELSTPRFYSHAVEVRGLRRTLTVSGQVSFNQDGSVHGQNDMRAQATRVFENVTHALAAAGGTWSDVIKMNAYMVNLNPANVAAYREARQNFVKGSELPASTLVGVTSLVHPDLLLEVEVSAVLGRAGGGKGGGAAAGKGKGKGKGRDA